MTKVFGIGFHKTGTTSLGEALKLLGYKNTHGAKAVRSQLGQEKMMKCLTQGKLEPIWEVAQAYNSFQDNPWQLLYRQADEKFPGSKFILTVRDSQSWYGSVLNYFQDGNSAFRSWVYGSDSSSPMGNKEQYINRYETHNLEVCEYFSQRPKDLLILNLANGEGWKELCNFLKVSVPEQDFPFANKRFEPTMLQKAIHKIKRTFNPRLS